MKVTCIENSGKFLSEKALMLGNTVETIFELEIGTNYFVYGIIIWKGVLHYLVIDQEGNLPSWYPAEIFHVSNNLLPLEWYFNYYSELDHDISAIWGYKELVVDEDHFDNLIERESEAIKVFLKRKVELEESS